MSGQNNQRFKQKRSGYNERRNHDALRPDSNVQWDHSGYEELQSEDREKNKYLENKPSAGASGNSSRKDKKKYDQNGKSFQEGSSKQSNGGYAKEDS